MPLYAFLATLILAVPVYAMLYATSLLIPLYVILLVIGIAGLSVFLQRSKGFWLEEVFSLMSLIIGAGCFFIGFGLAPLWLQLIGAIAILTVFRLRWSDVRIG